MIVLGTQLYAGGADAMRRQERAVAALLALRGAVPVNVQWVGEVFEWPHVETVPALREDSRTVTALPVRQRKPIMRELFDVLSDAASARGCPYFGFFNADIILSQAVVEIVERGGHDGYAFSRMDVDPETGRDVGLMLNGLDLFVFAVDWWRRARHRFRPYILGEWFYDPVFAAILMCHGDGLIVNRDGEIRHALHQHVPHSPLSRYNGYLAALDAGYFSLWAQYRHRLDRLRARGASDREERALQREAFVWRPTLGSRVRQFGRSLKATAKYRRLRAEMSRELRRNATGGG